MSTKEGAPGGHAILFPEKLSRDLFFWEVYQRDGQYLTAGYDADGYVLLVNAHGFTMETAWDYPTSPLRRYEALKAMGYI